MKWKATVYSEGKKLCDHNFPEMPAQGQIVDGHNWEVLQVIVTSYETMTCVVEVEC